MLIELVPDCPRLHHGIMVLDRPQQNIGDEWVCRICGTRLYAGDQGPVLPQVGGDGGADPRNGRPRENPTRPNKYSHKGSTDQGGRNGRGGKWYE